jgi:isopentenyl diphosphate isomerase/L-lactate dehydrogenase-like FMN-dependent dehydrogenase
MDGEDGVVAVLDAFRDDLERTMVKCGVEDVRQVPRDLVCVNRW